MDTARNSLIIFFSEIIIVAILFVVSVIVALKFGPEGKGIFDLFSATSALFSAIGGLGIGTASIYLINKKKENQDKILSNSLVLGLFFSVILDVLFLTVVRLNPSLFYGLPEKYLILLFFSIPLSLFHAYLLPFFLAKLKILYWAFISIFYVAFILIGTIISIFFIKIGIDGVIYSVIISGVFTIFLIIFYISKIISLHFIFDKKILIKQVKTGFKVYLGGIFTIISQEISLVIVNYFLGIANVGFYSVALNISGILLFIPYSFQQVLYANWSLSEEKKMDKNTAQVARQAFIIGALASLFFFFIGKFFIVLFYGKIFYDSVLPFYLILPGMPFIFFASIFFNNFFAKGKAGITTVILIIVLAINIFLSVSLTSLMGLAGAAVSVSVSYFFAAILAILFFSKVSFYSVFDIIKFRKEDLKLLKQYFFQIFKLKKILPLTADITINKLKEYYEEKAVKLKEDIIYETFESSHIFKKIFYASRLNKIMELLDIKPDDRILEIGCGCGYYTKKIAEITPNLVATDISQNYVNKAKDYNPHKIIDYIACPAEIIPFEDNYFDKILMSEVIEHLIDAKKGIKEVARVLKSGGKVVIDTPNKYSYLNILYHIKVTLAGDDFEQEHIKEFSAKELVGLFNKHFVIEKLCYINFFPIFIPKLLTKKIGFLRIDKFVQKIEKFFNKIPLIRRAGFIIMISAAKK